VIEGKDPSMKEAPVQSRIDNALIERCIEGDQAAWKELVKQYQRLVYSVAYAVCTQSEDVSDVFQQVWVELYLHLSELRNAEALPAWLITVTRRRAYNVLKSRRGSEPLAEEISDGSDVFANIEREYIVERAMEQVPERCRRLINLLYFDQNEPSYEEIAQNMKMPEASIGPTRARCLEKLRKLIG
jgi:RNA polymerase sigma factor (sigma-70 family)